MHLDDVAVGCLQKIRFQPFIVIDTLLQQAGPAHIYLLAKLSKATLCFNSLVTEFCCNALRHRRALRGGAWAHPLGGRSCANCWPPSQRLPLRLHRPPPVTCMLSTKRAQKPNLKFVTSISASLARCGTSTGLWF